MEELPDIFATATEIELKESEFRNKLMHAINYLLETNVEKLVNILYRIDIEEGKVNSILKGENALNGIAEDITDLIIQRQLQKIKLRKKYSGK